MLLKVFDFLRKNFLIFSIVLFSAVLRFYLVDQVPPSLNWDEVSHGYNAYSILRTGKDEWGFFLPIIFRVYGDYKLPVYIYVTAISEFFAGLSIISVRLPSILAGIGTVFFTYLLVLELFPIKKKKFQTINYHFLAIFSSFLVAIEPWSLFLSRGAFEANLAQFFIVCGTYFFLKGFKNPKYYLFSTFLWGLSVWTYNSARIFVPALIFLLVLIFKDVFLKFLDSNRRLAICTLLLFSLFFIPMFYQLFNPEGQARYSNVKIVDQGAIGKIIEKRQKSTLNPYITRLLYNRPLYFIQSFISNWTSHFNFSFLFFKGGDNYQFSLPGHGLLYLINLPFFLLGLFLISKSAVKKERWAIFILSWFLLGPIPSSLTREAPHVLRSITFLPIPMILTSYGLAWFITLFKKTLNFFVLMIYIIVILFLLGNYLNKYFGSYKVDYSYAWQYGYKDVVDFVRDRYVQYQKVIVTKNYGEPHEFFLFFWPWDPESYLNDPNLNRFYQSNWYWVDGFDKLYFINDWNIPKNEWEPFILESGKVVSCEKKKCLLVTTPGNVPKGWSILKTVYFLDGKKAFEIYEN